MVTRGRHFEGTSGGSDAILNLTHILDLSPVLTRRGTSGGHERCLHLVHRAPSQGAVSAASCRSPGRCRKGCKNSLAPINTGRLPPAHPAPCWLGAKNTGKRGKQLDPEERGPGEHGRGSVSQQGPSSLLLAWLEGSRK